MKIGRFIITSDKYQWILNEIYVGKDKDGNDKEHARETYHATLTQCCETIVQREAKLADDVSGIIDAINSAAKRIEAACSGIKKDGVK